MARIAVGGFHHETNCFVAERTDFAYFASHRDRPPLVRGNDVIEWLGDTSFALSGFLRDMSALHEIVPLLWTSGGAGGLVTADAYERIAGELVGRLSSAMPIDAVYLDLHGAMVSEPFEDGEGELLRRVRAAVGPQVPIAISLDYHSNVTPEMVEFTDSLVGYRTYPHVDRPETGQFAARAMSVLLRRGRPPGRTLRKLPFLIPLNDQCTLVEPSRSMTARSVVVEGDLINLSYLAGFPPSDLYWCGPAVIAHAWSQAAADRAADALTREIALREPEFAVPMVSPDDGVREAMAIARTASRPVVLCDTQDNPGCGASADTTGVLEALVRLGAEGAVVGYLCDEEAAATAHRAGTGADIAIALGGRFGPAGVVPFKGTFRVGRLGSGKMRTTGQVSGGREVDLGPMALLTTGAVSVAVTSKRMQALDQAPFRHLGVEPSQQKILALKSTCHFRAEFEPIAEKVIVVIAPGGYLADPAQYPYRRLRPGVRLRPLGPDFPGLLKGSPSPCQ
jgi:microcystin degradation protein MlrC